MLLQGGAGMIQKRRWLQTLTEATDLGDELVPGMPVVEIIGAHRVTVEGHNGVTEFSNTEISVSTSGGFLRISGTELVIAKMTRQSIVILGSITDVHMEEGRIS